MTSCCDSQDYNRGSNSGFIFGLLCGAVIGAVVAIIIYKNNKNDVFEKLSKQIKDFFDNLMRTDNKVNSPSKKNSPPKKKSIEKILAPSVPAVSKIEITPIFVKPKKLAPKTFIKPKK